METRIDFTNTHIVEQRIGGPDEMLIADVGFRATFPDGQSFDGSTKIKQTVGSTYGEKIIEVAAPTGLPPGRDIPHDQFSKVVTEFYTERIIKLG